jgi:hypothetical protein
MLVILIAAVAILLMYAVVEIDHRMNKNDPEVKW